MGWQPIETAPVNENVVVLYLGKFPYAMVAWYDNAEWCWRNEDNGDVIDDPDLWISIPARSALEGKE